jgi:hypothetical protein
MLMPAVVLDTAMTAAQVLARLARYGFWIDPQQPQAKAWIAECAQRMRLSFDDAAQRLMRSGWRTGAALRRGAARQAAARRARPARAPGRAAGADRA